MYIHYLVIETPAEIFQEYVSKKMSPENRRSNYRSDTYIIIQTDRQTDRPVLHHPDSKFRET